MRNHPSQALFLSISLLLVGAAMADSQGNQIANAGLALKVTPGAQYGVPKTVLLFFKITVYPQIACWLETPEGDFVDTMYVTAGGAKNNFLFAPRGGRPEALPVWYHRKMQRADVPIAVSGATSSAAADYTAKLSLRPAHYIVFLEVNRAYDYNDRFNRSRSGVNGQPSLIYRAELDVGKDAARAQFTPVGTGSVDGSDGNIRLGLDGITTALSIIDHAEIALSRL